MNKSGTRREDLLLSSKEMEAMWRIRKLLSNSDTAETTEKLITLMLQTKNNTEFVAKISNQLGSMKTGAYSS
jgi:transcription termination factor Rho